MDHVYCWHFASDTLRDGSPLPGPGDTCLLPPTKIEPCKYGYHGSMCAFDALRYAPGGKVARVRLHGKVIPHGNPVDKYCASERTNLTGYVDASESLRTFARTCALEVAHLWSAPDVVLEYLRTGNADLREAAWDAAWDAAEDAAEDAAFVGGWGLGAAQAAAQEVAWAAARGAARDAAQAAAQAAAWAAAWGTAQDAAWDAALDSSARRLSEILHGLLARQGAK